jgi:oligopeptidase B
VSTRFVQVPSVEPPVARRDPAIKNRHGDDITDDYAWLQDAGGSGLLDYLSSENTYAEQALAGLKSIQNQIYSETISRIYEDDEGVPYYMRGYWYYFRVRQGSQYQAMLRKQRLDGPEEVVLDLNSLARSHSYLLPGPMAVNDNNDLLAFSIDTTGSREFHLYIRNLSSGSEWDTGVKGVTSLAWAGGNLLFYALEDSTKRRFAIRVLDCAERTDKLVMEETDKVFNVAVQRSQDGSFIFLSSQSSDTSECSFIPSQGPLSSPVLIQPRRKGLQYFPEHRNGTFYLRTNDVSPGFRIVSAPVSQPGIAAWKEEMPAREGSFLADFEIFERFWVVTENREGLSRFKVRQFESGAEYYIEFSEPSYSAYSYCNADFYAHTFRYRYESPITPRSIYDFDLDQHASILLKRQFAGPADGSTLYQVERLYISVSDGTRVPVSIAYKKTGRPLFERPLYLYAYGAYGHVLTTSYSPAQVSLFDRGVIVGFVHVRGGGEYGRTWHDAGKAANKPRGILDFVEATEGLLAQGYGSPGKVAFAGGSAGGLLVAAAANIRPTLPALVLLRVPFVDVLNSMSDESLPLTTLEYQEWGDPRSLQGYASIKSYSPYENLKPTNYPAMLVRTSLNDRNVMCWEAAKYVAKLRATRTNHAPLFLLTNMHGGHGGASGRYDSWREVALDYAFLISELEAALMPHDALATQCA